MKKITKKEIKHLAELSSLEFSEQELEAFVPEFNNILEFIDKIAMANLPKVDTFSRVIPLENLREDEPKESYNKEILLKNAPKQKDGFFNVFKVVD